MAEDDRPGSCRVVVGPGVRRQVEGIAVPDREDLVHHEDLRFEVGGYGESQPHVHSAGVSLDWGVNKFFNLPEGDNLIEPQVNFVSPHSED